MCTWVKSNLNYKEHFYCRRNGGEIAVWHITIGYCCRHGIHCCVRPQPLMNKDIKVKDNKQKPKVACPAETEADSEPQPKITTSCADCSNTFVSCSFCRQSNLRYAFEFKVEL